MYRTAFDLMPQANPTRSLTLALAAGVLCLLSWSCDNRRPVPAKQPNLRLVVIGKARSDPTWAVIEAACHQFSDRKGRMVATADAPPLRSPSKQVDLLVHLSRSTTDAVCVHPDDPVLVAPAINQLIRAGIPVITFGRDSPLSNRMGYSGPVEMEMGRATARLCRKLLGEPTGSLMLLYSQDDDATSSRLSGFRQELPLQRGLQLLREIDCKANRIDAASLVKSESHRYPRAAAWAYLEDWLLRVTEPGERPVPLHGKVVLCSAEVCHWDALRDGRIDGMFGFDYPKAVHEALYAAVRFVNNSTQGFANEIHVTPEPITLDNLPKWEAKWLAWSQSEPTTQTTDTAPLPSLPDPADPASPVSSRMDH